MSEKPLQEFFAFVKDFRSIVALIGKAVIVLPLTDLILNIGPPWPNRLAITGLLSVMAVLILGYSFEFWRTTGSLTAVRRTLSRMMWLTFCACFVYVALFASFVVEVPDMWHRESIGFIMHDDPAQMYKDTPDRYPPSKLIELFDNDPQRVWQPWTVNIVRIVLLTSWLALWTILFAFVSAFVSIQYRRATKAGKGPKVAESSREGA